MSAKLIGVYNYYYGIKPARHGTRPNRQIIPNRQIKFERHADGTIKAEIIVLSEDGNPLNPIAKGLTDITVITKNAFGEVKKSLAKLVPDQQNSLLKTSTQKSIEVYSHPKCGYFEVVDSLEISPREHFVFKERTKKKNNIIEACINRIKACIR